VVSSKDNCRLLALAGRFQRLENLSDTVIEVLDLGLERREIVANRCRILEKRRLSALFDAVQVL
jgi:hypothetical protein